MSVTGPPAVPAWLQPFLPAVPSIQTGAKSSPVPKTKKGPLDYIMGLISGAGDLIQDNPTVSTGLVSLIGAGLSNHFGGNENNITPSGYQGGIPELTYNRQMLNTSNDPNRRPGSGGRRYFTDGQFTNNSAAQGIEGVNPESQESQFFDASPGSQGGGGGGMVTHSMMTRDDYSNKAIAARDMQNLLNGRGGGGGFSNNAQLSQFATGGIAQLPMRGYAEGGEIGQYLRGETDGMSDEILTTIDGQQPAALSHGEFVIPADIVSHLGNGNSDAGAKMLEQMMSRVRKERTGNNKQGKEIDANQFLPR